jgi:hypothetical protein
MNLGRSSPTTRALLAAAKNDVPSPSARASVWAGVAGSIGAGGASGASGSAHASVTSGASATKVFALGTLLGGTLVVGLAATVLCIGIAAHAPRGANAVGIRGEAARLPSVTGVSNHESTWTPTSVPISTWTPTATPLPTTTAACARARPPSVSPRLHATTPLTRDDSLTREASFVEEARAALVRGDAVAALRAIATARSLPARQLVPEELAVEAQALRSLGRNGEANDADEALKSLYPESVLAR